MTAQVNAYWQTFLDSLPPDAPHPAAFLAWGFGDSPRLADELGALVVAGAKTATASLEWEYGHDGEVMPQVGDYSVILDGKGEPMCIIETTRVYIKPFNEVDAEQGYEEGEGDRSLAYWREVHWRYFSRVCAQIGREPDETMPVVCERFRVVWK